MRNIERSFRLTNEPGGMGLSCTAAGLSLAGIPLLRKTEAGFAPRPADEISALIGTAYRSNADPTLLLPSLDLIARALNRGDLAHAMTAAVLTQPPELSWEEAARVAEIDDWISKYDPDQPRDRHGRWTSGDVGNPEATTAPKSLPNTNTVQGARVRLAGRWPDTHRDSPNIVPAQAIPLPLFPPPIVGGAAGSPKSKDDDDYVFPPPPIPETSAGQGANDVATARARATTENDPVTCPDPSFEAGYEHRTPGQLLYQAQISGLPIGMGVNLNGVQFDGCRESDGTMLEAKNISPWFVDIPGSIFRTFSAYRDIIEQAGRQIIASGSRKIEWHFSDPRVAEFWRREFARLNFKITVRYTPMAPAIVKFIYL